MKRFRFFNFSATPHGRFYVLTISMFMTACLLCGCADRYAQKGLAYAGKTVAEHVQLLVDETWVDAETGERHVSQEIFDSVFGIIHDAEEFLLLDFFLINDFLYEPGPGLRPLSEELVNCLIAKRKKSPNVEIVLITDPINTVYGSIESSYFKAMRDAGVRVVMTDLDRLRDSNPIYSKPWRLLVNPLGTGPGDAIINPLGNGRISMRSMLKLLNFKANHRKLVASEKSILVTSANPHSASSAHWNVALRFDGAGMGLACEAESAILRLSGADRLDPVFGGRSQPQSADREESAPISGSQLELLTEIKIKEKVLAMLDGAKAGARIDLGMFYFSEHDVLDALLEAKQRGCNVRVVLDPNKDAFGRTKNGIPNRQTAARLVDAGIPVRWADTHGEQFHVKMLYVENSDGTAAVLLGSCNFTRRNMDDFNAECSVVYTAPQENDTLACCRQTFDRWWSNPDGRVYTTDYRTYADSSLHRRIRAWLMERSGLSSF